MTVLQSPEHALPLLLVSISQVIGCEDRLWNDLDCVGWGSISKASFESFITLLLLCESFVCRSTSIRTMSVLHSRAGSPHTGTLNSYFNSAASSGSVTLDRMHHGDFTAYSPNLSNLAPRNLTYTGFDGQSYRLPQVAGEQWGLSRNGPRLTTSNHRGSSVCVTE